MSSEKIPELIIESPFSLIKKVAVGCLIKRASKLIFFSMWSSAGDGKPPPLIIELCR
ncbi:MAG: hypothetical protein HON32_04950 [Francisellaceae bacterium]|nr:hypothetical protein [Francisellaceae bacterium]